jgi:3-methyladenine DNA glycosylase/8-oxoguanine DNA glycosylase
MRVYTVGHSTRTLDELVEILRAFGVTVLVDIRTVPRSRRNPQFNRDALGRALRARRLRYVHLPELGGLRRARKDSPNTAWRNASFRGYADHMRTPEFEAGLTKLHALAADRTIALMCAEAVPWRCHRSLVADALTARGAHVEHITSATRASPHRMTPFARVDGARVTYPGDGAGGERLATRAPFHLEATVRVLQRRPTNLVDVWAGDRYLRVLTTPGGLVLVEVVNAGTIDAPELRLRLRHGDDSSATRTSVEQTLRAMLGLEVDPAPLARLVAAEPGLGRIALALRGMRPPRFAGLFEAVANVIPFQQVSLDAGAAIVRRLVERYGASLEHDGRRLHAFPAAGAIAGARVDALRACGLSGRKAEALRHAARAIEAGELTEAQLARLPSRDAIRRLSELPGIGPWSAALILLRGLGRLDVFPPGDVGATRGLGELLQLRAGPALARAIERFGDHRGYLYFCALGAALLGKDLIHAAPPPRRPGRRAAAAGGRR